MSSIDDSSTLSQHTATTDHNVPVTSDKVQITWDGVDAHIDGILYEVVSVSPERIVVDASGPNYRPRMTAEQGKKMRAERKHAMAVKDHQLFQELRSHRRGGVGERAGGGAGLVARLDTAREVLRGHDEAFDFFAFDVVHYREIEVRGRHRVQRVGWADRAVCALGG